jgi:hypothetical protein
MVIHDVQMRTTLSLDPDVAELIRQEMVHRKVSLKELINGGLRIGLSVKESPGRKVSFKVKPHASGYKAGIDATKLNQLVDELEAESFLYPPS